MAIISTRSYSRPIQRRTPGLTPEQLAAKKQAEAKKRAPKLTPEQLAAKKKAEAKQRAEREARKREDARERKYKSHFGAFESALKQVGKRLPKDGLGSRYIHSSENFVKVTEGLTRSKGENTLTVIRQRQGNKFGSFAGRSLKGTLTAELVYTRYTFGDTPDGKVVEENFKLQPDGTSGQVISQFTMTPSDRTVEGSNDQDTSNSTASLWKGVLGLGEAAPKPVTTESAQSMEPILSRVESLRLGELNRTFDQLSELALKHDGAHLDHDGQKNGKVNLAPLESYAGILLGEERSTEVPEEGIRGRLGLKEERLNPYTWLSTHGSIAAGESGVTSMDLVRQRTKVADSQEVPELKPSLSEAHFHQRTESNGAKVYEVRTEGKVERLIEESNGTISYFANDKEMPELINHDLPGFQHKARDPQTQEEFLNIAYLSHHQEIARLPAEDQPKAWADKSLRNGIDPDYAIKSIQNYTLNRQQRVALRTTQKKANELESTTAQLAVKKATLMAFRATDSENPTLADIGKAAKAIVDASRQERGEDQKLFVETGVQNLYRMSWRPGYTDLKLGMPAQPKEMANDPHFLAQLMELK